MFRGLHSLSLIYTCWSCPYSCAITPVLSFLCIHVISVQSCFKSNSPPNADRRRLTQRQPDRHLCPPLHSLVLSDRPQVLEHSPVPVVIQLRSPCVRLRQLSGNHQAAADAGNRARPHSLTLRLSLWPTLLNRMGLELDGKPSLQFPVVQKY